VRQTFPAQVGAKTRQLAYKWAYKCTFNVIAPPAERSSPLGNSPNAPAGQLPSFFARPSERDTQRETDRETKRERETERERHTHRVRDRPRETERDLDARSFSSRAPNDPPPPPPTWVWVDLYVPNAVQPYARLARMDKPIGTLLLLWPCWWSTALAAQLPHELADPKLLALFGVGAFIMRGAGCTINDMWDADFDRRVARTRSRPLANGDLTHAQAWGFLGVQLMGGLAILLSLPHTLYCFQVGATSLPMVRWL